MPDIDTMLRDSDPAPRPAGPALRAAAVALVEAAPSRRSRPWHRPLATGVVALGLLGAGTALASATGALQAVFGAHDGQGPVASSPLQAVPGTDQLCTIGVWVAPNDELGTDGDGDGIVDSVVVDVPTGGISVIGAQLPSEFSIEHGAITSFSDAGDGWGEPWDQPAYDGYEAWIQSQDWSAEIAATIADGDEATMGGRMLDRIAERMERSGVETRGMATVFASGVCGTDG